LQVVSITPWIEAITPHAAVVLEGVMTRPSPHISSSAPNHHRTLLSEFFSKPQWNSRPSPFFSSIGSEGLSRREACHSSFS
jgi:hypothetical protein